MILFVLPRAGSISPWSSKATDIARICNLNEVVDRIERGVLFALTLDNPEADISPFIHLLHDRMTQSVHINALPSAEDIFHTSSTTKRRPLTTVDLLSHSTHEDRVSVLQQANVDLGLALSGSDIEYLGTFLV